MERTSPNEVTTESIHQHSLLTQDLREIFSFGITSGYSGALWRLPNEQNKFLVLAHEVLRKAKGTSFDDLQPGFIFAPFDKTQEDYFIPADYAFTLCDDGMLPPSNGTEGASHAWLEEKRKSNGVSASPSFYQRKSDVQGKSMNQEAYEHLVRQCLTVIADGQMEKLVPSRYMQIFLSDDFDPIKLFNRLCHEYPHALISLVTLAGVGTWIGATPELLVRVEDKQKFHTVALAGTKQYQTGINLKSVAWTQKEIEEQALVERYVISCFKKIRLREYEEHGPKTVVAGNLMHLRSDFIVDMVATNFPQLGSVMLQLLHPTSAICGTPMQASEAYLREHEGYNREFYGGYLGPVNMVDQVNIFVNLRCLQLVNNDQALLYAGAGVTIDSIPTEEWKETELKMRTLLSVIEKPFGG